MTYAFNNCEITKINLSKYPDHSYLITGVITIIIPGNKTVKEDYSVTVKAPDLFKYHNGVLIQDAFPYLSIKDREFLMSGMYWDYDPGAEDAEDRAVDQQLNMIRGK